MGLFDFFGGSGPEKALKLKPKVTQKYGDPASRQKAIQQLGEMKFPEAVSVLLSRFTLTVEPLTTDADEKEHVFELIKGFDKDAIAPIQEFLRKSDQATSWALRLLGDLLPEPEVIGICVDTLTHLSSHYTRDPEKKVVLLHHVTGKEDPRIASRRPPLPRGHVGRREDRGAQGARAAQVRGRPASPCSSSSPRKRPRAACRRRPWRRSRRAASASRASGRR